MNIVSSVIAMRGSEIPNKECSMLTSPKTNTKINEKLTKLSPFLNGGESITFIIKNRNRTLYQGTSYGDNFQLFACRCRINHVVFWG